MGLTRKQQRFVAEYMKDSNATQAAIRAGFSAKTAKQQGSRMLTNVDVSAAIGCRTEKVAMTADEILKELGDIARHGERDNDRIAAMGLLGKNLKLFTDRVAMEGSLTLEQIVLAADRKARGSAD